MRHIPSGRAITALLLAVSFALVFPALPRPATAGPTTTVQDGTHLETVRTAYDLLLDQLYRPSDPAMLLGAAWRGAVAALREAGVRDLAAAPALERDREAAWDAFAASYPALLQRAPERLSATDLAFAAVDEMTESVDEQHTFFLTPSQYEEFSASLTGGSEEVGLGVELDTRRGTFLVAEVAPGGPAETAGLRPGDTIVAADGVDLGRASRATFIAATDGPPGTDVRLTLDRPGIGAVGATVVLDTFHWPDFEARVLADGTGYMRLRGFTSFLRAPSGRPNVIEELDAALARFEGAGVTRWVLDLRGNPGGFVLTANEVVGRFLPNVATVINENDRGDRGVELSSGRGAPVQRPLAVLIDEGSASSSENVASTLLEHGRAVIVGQTSAGVLATAGTFPLPDGAALNIALARVLTAKDNALVDEVGIKPQIAVADRRTAEDYADGRDPQLDAAIAALRDRGVDQPTPAPFSGQLDEAALRSRLAGALPGEGDVPAAPMIPSPRVLGDLPVTDPNRYASGAEEPFALARTVQARGWQGAYGRVYAGPAGLSGASLISSIDLYASISGAVAALNTNDFPRLQREAPVPEQLGEGTVAYLGRWLGAGGALVQVRVDRAVVSVTYYANPGEEDLGPAVELARIIAARLTRVLIPESMTAPALTP
jgi:C-terminal peptidase prc